MTEKNYLALFAKSFNWAGFFLPKNIYRDCSKLYAFCRVLDDLVDEKTNIELRTERFNKIRDFFNRAYEQNNNNNNELIDQYEHISIINEMIVIADNKGIKKIVLDDLIEGVGSDLKIKIHLRSVKDLLLYSYRVAGTVGLMMAKILNVNDTRSLKGAIDLGIAMQLTNIARDVVEDKNKNRIYLIKSSEDTFLDIKKIIYKADSFYDSSFVGIRDIDFSCRFSIIVARRVYRQIGKKILQKKDVDSYRKAGKIYVSNFGKIIQTIFSLSDLIMLFFIKPGKHEKEREYNLINEDIGLNERI